MRQGSDDNVRLRENRFVKSYTVSTGYLLSLMESADNTLNIMILDTVRNNPFRTGITRGISKIVVPKHKGTFMAFATSPGRVALDSSNEGRNGLYTMGILKFIQQPQLSLEQIFKKVRFLVEQESEGKQIPWYSSTLSKDFYFSSCKKAK